MRLEALVSGDCDGPLLAYGPQLAAVAQALGIGVSVDAVFGTSSSAAIMGWARDVFDFATLQGARAPRDWIRSRPASRRTWWSSTPTDGNTMPLNDAVGTVVLGADPGNIETVLVMGVIRRSGRRLVDVDVAQLHEQVVASRDAIFARAAA